MPAPVGASAIPSVGAGSLLAPPPALPSGARVEFRVDAPFATEAVSSSSASSSGSNARRPNFQYDLSDIERAHSISYISRLHKDPRCPLDPIYKLPSVEVRPVTPPRFVRASLVIDDIEKTRSSYPAAVAAGPPRAGSSLDVSDLGPAARPLSRYQPLRKMQSTSLDSRDITHTKFVSTRCTDPLDPVYKFGRSTNLDVSSIISALGGSQAASQSQATAGGSSDSSSNSNLVEFGPVAGAKSRQLPVARHPDNVLSLRTSDISSPEAHDWSWTKPARKVFRNTTDTHDIPGAQGGADRTKMHKTTRRTDPNLRNYTTDGEDTAGSLGGHKVSSQAGMVHVHRHVLDETPFAASWKPQQVVPAPDAAGISMWHSGTFTAGVMPPKPMANTSSATAPAPASASTASNSAVHAAAAANQQQQQQQQQAAAKPARQPFGAPAEDMGIHESPSQQSQASQQASAPVVRVATPTVARTKVATSLPSSSSVPDFSASSFTATNAPTSSAPPSSSSAAPIIAATAAAAAAAPSSATSSNLSYPPDARGAPIVQKRHPAPGVHNYSSGSLLADPPSNGRETALALMGDARIPPMTFGVRGPFAVRTAQASIEQSQAASTVSATSTAAASRVGSRTNSRPSSRNQLLMLGLDGHMASAPSVANPRPGSAAATQQHLSRMMEAFSPTASTLSNAFSLAFVPTSTTTLPRALPFSSPVARPGLGTIEQFERSGGAAPPPRAHMEALARTQERKMATMRAAEIQQVRLLA